MTARFATGLRVANNDDIGSIVRYRDSARPMAVVPPWVEMAKAAIGKARGE